MNSTLTNNSTIDNPVFENLLNPEVGTFILRVALGSVLLAHSVYLKLIVFTLPGTAQFFASIGLPGFLACDGTHKDTDITPVEFTIEEKKTVWLCGCRKSGNKPMCDGTHKK